MENYQRKGSNSNKEVGDIFEEKVFNYFYDLNISLEKQKKIEIGINKKKAHAFDFGNNDILIECKAQTWTESENAPSAKLKNWSDAMFSFYLAPKNYKKLFFVEMSYSQKHCKSLLEYFVEHYFYLIPDDVILIDFYTENGNMDFYMYDEKQKIHVKNNNVEKLF